MKFTYKKEANIKVGQKLYGIVEVSIYTYDGVYPITVDFIDFKDDIVIFNIDQPCRRVACGFSEIERFVFETEEEAKEQMDHLKFGEGLYAFSYV